MPEYTLYHMTLAENTSEIDRQGIMLNRGKAERPIKGFTDLFNDAFGKWYPDYLPWRVPTRDIDRNSAIFLSAHPDEFRRSREGAQVIGHTSGEDALYRVRIVHDLPAFDAAIYDRWAEAIVSLGDGPVIASYFAQSSYKDSDDKDDVRLFSNLISYLMGGDFKLLGMADETEPSFNQMREDAFAISAIAVRDYCKNAISVSALHTLYTPHHISDGIEWRLNGQHHVNHSIPATIKRLEILCSTDIPKENIMRLERF